MYFLLIELDQQVETHTVVCRENVMRLLIRVIIVLYIFLIVIYISNCSTSSLTVYGLIVEIIYNLPIYS